MITSVDGIVAALGNSAIGWPIQKASMASTVAGQWFSLWTSAGNPGAGSAPGTVTVPTSATTGAFTFTAPAAGLGTYLGRSMMVSSNSGTDVQFHDRLTHCGGLSGTVTTAQAANVDCSVSTSNMVNRRGSADYSEVQWWIEIYGQLGSAALVTVNVTYADDTSVNLPTISLGGTPRVGRMYPILSATPGKYIKKVNTVQLSASTGTAGNFGVTATNALGGISLGLANTGQVADWAALGLSRVHDDACISMVTIPGTTTTGTLYGSLKLIQG